MRGLLLRMTREPPTAPESRITREQPTTSLKQLDSVRIRIHESRTAAIVQLLSH